MMFSSIVLPADFANGIPFLAQVQTFGDSSLVGQIIVIILILCSVLAWTAMGYKWARFDKIAHQNTLFFNSFRKENHPLALFLREKRYPDSPAYKLYLRSCQSATRTLGISEPGCRDA